MLFGLACWVGNLRLRNAKGSRQESRFLDHIPLPKTPQLGPILVPCLARQDFDGESYAEYPERAGWKSRTRNEWLALFQQPPQEFRAFLQTWRYFGLVASVFKLNHGKAPQIANLTRNTASGRVVDTSKLSDISKRLMNEVGLREFQEAINLESEQQDSVGSLPPHALFTLLRDQIGRLKFHNSSVFWSIAETMASSFMIEQAFRKPLRGCNCSIDSTLVQPLYTFVSNTIIVDPLPPEIHDSIDLVLEMATGILAPKYAAKYLYDMPTHSLGTYSPGLSRIILSQSIPLHSQSPFVARMIEKGWCPSLTNQLCQRFGISAMIFVGNLEKPDQLNHQSCNQERCAFDKVDEKNYNRMHAPACAGAPGCFDVLGDKALMHAIFKHDCFPIISTISQKNGDLAMKLLDSRSTKDYVAISHVWSDGLGNPKENAVLHCQLQALSGMVAALPIPSEPGLPASFWLDTICCPVEKNKDKDVAIGLMKDTYEKASVILVLDSSILSQNAADMDDVEIMLRILRSRWTTRLWTLQEGALAQRLFFQFADGPYDVQEGIRRIQESSDIRIQYTIKPTILQEFLELRVFHASNMSKEQKIVALSRSMRFRATSVDTDEPICLATMLGFDAREMRSTAPQDRMRRFWDSLPGIPSNILFLHCERRTDDRYKWAPRSFLRTATGSPSQLNRLPYNDFTNTEAKLSKKGLKLEATIMALSCSWSMPLGDMFHVFAMKDRTGEEGDWYWVETKMEHEKSAVSYDQPSSSCNHVKKCLRMLPPSGSSRPRLFIMLQSRNQLEVTGTSEAILLSGNSTVPLISAQPVCEVRLWKLSNPRHVDQIIKLEEMKRAFGQPLGQVTSGSDKRTGNLMVVLATPPTQREICIG